MKNVRFFRPWNTGLFIHCYLLLFPNILVWILRCHSPVRHVSPNSRLGEPCPLLEVSWLLCSMQTFYTTCSHTVRQTSPWMPGEPFHFYEPLPRAWTWHEWSCVTVLLTLQSSAQQMHGFCDDYSSDAGVWTRRVRGPVYCPLHGLVWVHTVQCKTNLPWSVRGFHTAQRSLF